MLESFNVSNSDEDLPQKARSLVDKGIAIRQGPTEMMGQVPTRKPRPKEQPTEVQVRALMISKHS